MNGKKILILNYEYPPLGGGAGVVSQKYAQGLADLGNKVVVVTTWFEGQKEIEEIGNLTIIKLKSRRKKIFQSNPIEMLSWAFHTIKFLRKYLKTNKFDINLSFFGVPGGIVAKYIYDRFHLPYIISTHGADIPGFDTKNMWLYHWLTSWYIKRVRKSSEKILFLTGDMYKLGELFAPRFKSKFVILPNGCNTDFFYPDVSQKNSVFKMLFVGRFVDQKDPFTMLNAVRKFGEQNKEYVLNIVGDGPFREDMENFVNQNGLQNNVKFKGWVSKEEIRQEYQSSHIQICTSNIEAMSVAILESLFCGLYILSTPVSGNTDVIKESVNGEFFEIGDCHTLADKLLYRSKNFDKIPFDIQYLAEIKKIYNRQNIIKKLNDLII